jgi:hypothetical protein
MAEFKYTGSEVVMENDPIIFKNNTNSLFSVKAGICFLEDGEYHVSVHNNVVIVTAESQIIKPKKSEK